MPSEIPDGPDMRRGMARCCLLAEVRLRHQHQSLLIYPANTTYTDTLSSDMTDCYFSISLRDLTDFPLVSPPRHRVLVLLHIALTGVIRHKEATRL